MEAKEQTKKYWVIVIGSDDEELRASFATYEQAQSHCEKMWECGLFACHE
jgi:hypothetical protein